MIIYGQHHWYSFVNGSFHFLDQSFAETKDWDQTAQLLSQSGVEFNESPQRVIADVSATHHWFRRISLFSFELAKKWSDFHSLKLILCMQNQPVS